MKWSDALVREFRQKRSLTRRRMGLRISDLESDGWTLAQITVAAEAVQGRIALRMSGGLQGQGEGIPAPELVQEYQISQVRILDAQMLN